MKVRFCIISTLFSLTTLVAQENRPKVGLVLSGGASHGIAHIGVLKVLEEQGVHIDYITGTSMGSIIGGLYAMGMTPEEIEDLTYDQNWSELLATNVPLNEVAPSEKLYHNRYGLSMEIRDGGLKLPEGFLNSQKLDLELNRMFCSAHDINDFDDLAYPFKCVSVNIENGDVEVLDRGYLGTAVRSSMAIPSVFAPVEINGKLLVDGGLIRNFPVEEAQEMGADIIIGVYVGSKLEDKQKLNNLLEILNQSAFMMGILDSEEQKKKVDILIQPDVKEYPTFGFDLTDVFIREGYIAATGELDAIKELAADQKKYNLEKPDPLPPVDQLELADTRFPFIRSPYDALANFKYGIRKKGPVTLDYIESGINRIFGTKHFDNINYTFKTNSRGAKILTVLAKPRHVNVISGAFNFLSSSGTSLILTNELRNVIKEPSVLYSTIRLAENYGVKLDYNYRLGKKKDFILNVLGLVHRYDQNLYEAEILREQYVETSSALRLGIGYEPNNNILISGSGGVRGIAFKPIGLDEDGLSRYRRLDATLDIGASYDNIDAAQFPDKGMQLGIGVGLRAPIVSKTEAGDSNILSLIDDELYADLSLKGNAYYPLTTSITGELALSGGYKTKASLTDNYRIGGLEDRDHQSITMLGLNTHQLHMSRYYKTGLGIRIKVFNNAYFTMRGDYMKGERTFMINTIDEDIDISVWGYGGILGLKTPLGPLMLSYGRNSFTDSWNTNFRFGYSFF